MVRVLEEGTSQSSVSLTGRFLRDRRDQVGLTMRPEAHAVDNAVRTVCVTYISTLSIPRLSTTTATGYVISVVTFGLRNSSKGITPVGAPS